MFVAFDLLLCLHVDWWYLRSQFLFHITQAVVLSTETIYFGLTCAMFICFFEFDDSKLDRLNQIN